MYHIASWLEMLLSHQSEKKIQSSTSHKRCNTKLKHIFDIIWLLFVRICNRWIWEHLPIFFIISICCPERTVWVYYIQATTYLSLSSHIFCRKCFTLSIFINQKDITIFNNKLWLLGWTFNTVLAFFVFSWSCSCVTLALILISVQHIQQYA